jgi:uncharacterized membrane protein YjjP (DUF1212 family)
MADPIKRALTRRRFQRGRLILEEPNERTVYVVKFALGMAVCLVALQVAHLAFLGAWNSEVFAAIAGLCGTVMGVFVGQKT